MDKVNFCVDIDMCEDFLGGGGGGGLTVLSTPVQMFSVTQCDYRSFCAYAVSFGMAWRSIETPRLVFLGKKFLKPNRSTSLHVDAVLPDLF